MKAFALATVLLAVASSASAQDATALQGLQACVAANKNSLAYVNGWGLGASTATSGRKLQQTAQNCADLQKLAGNSVPCTPQTAAGTTSGTPTTPTAPTTPSYGTPPTAGAAPGVNTSPSGVPTGTSNTNPCGDTSNPVPWTGLLCSGTGGTVTQVLMSQLGPNAFKTPCNLSTLGGLSGLSSLQNLDFTAVGLSGSIPANWTSGAWASTLQTITLAENPLVTGPIANFSGLTALTSIDVHDAAFSGSIPLSSQGYPSLRSFVASGNDLTGPLPTSLPQNLTTLNVGDNQLNGTLPSYTSSVLGTFQVNNNTLSGCLPAGWTTGLTNLTNVDLSYNDFTGSIPSTWQANGAFPTLQTIDIVGNQLCGSTGSLGTPVGNVGQNNPSATRLVPNPGTLPACSGTESCNATSSPISSRIGAFYSLNGSPVPAPAPNPALAPQSAASGSQAPSLPVLPPIIFSG